ncbi:hypothetical protein J4440_00510 [Candidatus Woesearchaeota archaeon]|nr:hypothetical protein [Candidatus Woesearchaeota archaeon]
METPQELEVWYIIPALRRELTSSMKISGLKQVEIANKLGLTKSAVTQYLNHKRASELAFNNKIKDAINESSKRIRNKLDAIREIQLLLNLTRQERVVCELHKKLDKDFNGCEVCYDQK